MEPGWWLKLEGDDEHLRALCVNFDVPELRVVAVGRTFYVGSTRFDKITSYAGVRTEATRLLRIIAASETFDGRPMPLPSISSGVRVDQEGRRRYLRAPTIVDFGGSVSILPRRESRLRDDGTVETVELTPEPRSPHYAELAYDEPAIEDALIVLSRGDVRWVELYLVFELVEAAVGGEMFTRGWTTKADVRRFTQTANSREALGRAARHGHSKTPAPARPMQLNDARTLVRSLVRHWLEQQLAPRKMIERVVDPVE